MQRSRTTKPIITPFIRPLTFAGRLSQSDVALRRSGHESTIRARITTNEFISFMVDYTEYDKNTCESVLIYDCAIFITVHALTDALRYAKINQ